MLTRLFCDTDDFYHDFIPQWEATRIENKEKRRKRYMITMPSAYRQKLSSRFSRSLSSGSR